MRKKFRDHAIASLGLDGAMHWRSSLVLVVGSAAALQFPVTAAVSRRGVVQGIALAAALPRLAASADDDAALAPLPPQPPPMEASDISYEALKVRLIECKDPELCTVERVAFLSANGEEADVVLKSGERLPIIGIPQENPSNDSSPAKLIAKLRDSKVPFSFPFTDALKKR